MNATYKIYPLLGTDAVHGNQHVVGSVLFPHNIGMAATHNASNFYNSGEATGKSVKESLKDEFKNVKENTKRKVLTLGVDYLKDNNSAVPPKRRKKNSSRSSKKIKLKRKRDIFD